MTTKAMLLQNHMVNNALNGFTMKETQACPQHKQSSCSAIYIILNLKYL